MIRNKEYVGMNTIEIMCSKQSAITVLAIVCAMTIPVLGCDNDEEKEASDGGAADPEADSSIGAGSIEESDPAYHPAVLDDGEIELPLPTGRYRVGLSERVMTKGEELAKEADAPIAAYTPYFVRVFYPIDPEYSGETFVYDALVSCGTGEQVLTHSFRNVGVASGDDRFPVVLFAPGHGTPINVYVSLLEDLASHGYVVAAFQPDKTFNLSALEIGTSIDSPDPCATEEEWLTYLEDQGTTSEKTEEIMRSFESLVQLWLEDAVYVLDQLEQLDKEDPQGVLTNRLDLEKVGMFGHSLGGATAHQACATDPRFKACENLDGRFFGDNIDNPLNAPLMVQLTGEHSVGEFFNPYVSVEVQSIDETQETVWDAITRAPGYRIAIRDIAHLSFSDVNAIERHFIWNEPPAGDEACVADIEKSLVEQCVTKDGQIKSAAGTLDPVRAIEISNAYTVAFFDKYLKGIDHDFLDGPSDAYPEVTFEAKHPQ